MRKTVLRAAGDLQAKPCGSLPRIRLNPKITIEPHESGQGHAASRPATGMSHTPYNSITLNLRRSTSVRNDYVAYLTRTDVNFLRRRSKVAVFVSAALSLALSATVAAADSIESSDQSATSPQEVLVTAQKRTERLQDVPAPVTVLDTTVLAETNQTSFRDTSTTGPGGQERPASGTVRLVGRGGDLTGT
jgi:hypothetical protein